MFAHIVPQCQFSCHQNQVPFWSLKNSGVWKIQCNAFWGHSQWFGRKSIVVWFLARNDPLWQRWWSQKQKAFIEKMMTLSSIHPLVRGNAIVSHFCSMSVDAVAINGWSENGKGMPPEGSLANPHQLETWWEQRGLWVPQTSWTSMEINKGSEAQNGAHWPGETSSFCHKGLCRGQGCVHVNLQILLLQHIAGFGLCLKGHPNYHWPS